MDVEQLRMQNRRAARERAGTHARCENRTATTSELMRGRFVLGCAVRMRVGGGLELRTEGGYGEGRGPRWTPKEAG